LQKLLAAAGIGSRRRIESWIAAGRVTIGGRPARLGERASSADAIALDGNPIALGVAGGALPRVIAYHKPAGELVTRDDPLGRSTVFAQLPPLRGGRWVAVGRLDMNTSGLLLLTDSGELANRLMHPRHAQLREYAARVRGELDREQRRRLLTGVRLADGIARFEQLDPMTASPGEGANRWYRAGLREGRNREVRRLFEAVGLQVSRLIRVRFGPLILARDLRPGRWRELSRAEVRSLLA
jgi:23S rRNA pseudouridine2605 synthase